MSIHEDILICPEPRADSILDDFSNLTNCINGIASLSTSRDSTPETRGYDQTINSYYNCQSSNSNLESDSHKYNLSRKRTEKVHVSKSLDKRSKNQPINKTFRYNQVASSYANYCSDIINYSYPHFICSASCPTFDNRMYATMNPTTYNASPYFYSSLAPAVNATLAAPPSHLTHHLSAFVGTPHVQSNGGQHTAYQTSSTSSNNSHSASNGMSNSFYKLSSANSNSNLMSNNSASNVSPSGSNKNNNAENSDNMSTSNGPVQNGERVSRTNLYIKGLTEDFTDQRLKDLVPDPNLVKSVKAATEDDNKCRGYGFIDFISEEAAQTALRYMQKNCESLTVKFAKENEKDKTNLYVTNIPKTWTTKDSDKLKDLFSRFGPIQSAFIMIEKSPSKAASGPGVGFVRFQNEEDAQKAMETIKNHPQILPGCSSCLECKYADKHNPETRRKRTNNQLNGTVRGAIPATSNFPLIQAPAAGFQGLYNIYRPATTPGASPYSTYQLAAAAAAYPQSLPAQSLLSNGGFYMPAATAPAQTSTQVQNAVALQALQGHTNGVTDASSLTSFAPQLFLANNHLTSPAAGLTTNLAAAAAYAHHGFADYPYSAYISAGQPAEHH